MADIFISYAREERPVAALLARALERCGWSVWWDRIIPPGKTFDEVIEAELASARCTIVLWSKASVVSSWVRDEAQEAANRRKLVPAILDGVEPPMGFRRIQAADLASWRGDDGHSGWQDLKSAVGDLLGELSYPDAKTVDQRGDAPRATEHMHFPADPTLWGKVIALCCLVSFVSAVPIVNLLKYFLGYHYNKESVFGGFAVSILIGIIASRKIFAKLKSKSRS